jgi:hypothetical protein
MAAALLHDVGITPFGHLMEEGFRYASLSFDHEQRLGDIFRGEVEVGNVNYQLFRGRPLGTRSVLARREWLDLRFNLTDIFRAIRGETVLGPLISGTVDLDNIDNVCRMAYHIGLRFRPDLPIGLIEAFYFERDRLCFDEDHLPCLIEWLDLRRRLYTVLMSNPTDFIAKAMLVEAIRRALIGHGNHGPTLEVGDWRMTDAELLQRLAGFKPSASLVDRLERGDLHRLVGPYWVGADASVGNPFTPERSYEHRRALASRLGTTVDETLVYLIKDKRVRLIDNLYVGRRHRGSAAQVRTFGEASRLVLFGVAVGQDIPRAFDADAVVASYLREASGSEVRLYRVDTFAAEIGETPPDPQFQLF